MTPWKSVFRHVCNTTRLFHSLNSVLHSRSYVGPWPPGDMLMVNLCTTVEEIACRLTQDELDTLTGLLDTINQRSEEAT